MSVMMESTFDRVINKREVLALAFGAMVGWSWVALSGVWIATAGSVGAIVAFTVGGSVVVCIGLTYAELAAAMPQVGGEHVYSKRALGRTASFVCTWAILLGYVSVVAFEAVALPTVLEYLWPSFSRVHLWTVAGWKVNATWVATGSLLALGMIVVNVLGIRTAARLQMLAVVIVLVSGGALFAGAAINGDIGHAVPLVHGGIVGVLSVLVMVPFMFVGFDVIPQSAEEINLPFAEIGRVLVLSIVVAIIWYSLVIWAVSSGLHPGTRAGSDLATADAAAATLGGQWAGQVLVAGGIAGILTSWNAFLIGGSRALYALAKAGQVAGVFGKLHPSLKTPHYAILFIGGLAVIAPLFGRPAMIWFVNAGGLGIVIAYSMVALSFLVLRVREPQMDRPYRVGHGKLVGSLALILSIGIATLCLPWSAVGLAWQEWLIVAAWCAVGWVLHRPAAS